MLQPYSNLPSSHQIAHNNESSAKRSGVHCLHDSRLEREAHGCAGARPANGRATCLCMYICIHIYVYANMYAYVYVYVYIYIYIYMCVCMCARIHTCMHICMHAHTHIHTYLNDIDICAHTCYDTLMSEQDDLWPNVGCRHLTPTPVTHTHPQIRLAAHVHVPLAQ